MYSNYNIFYFVCKVCEDIGPVLEEMTVKFSDNNKQAKQDIMHRKGFRKTDSFTC